jgi:hypothetical protein
VQLLRAIKDFPIRRLARLRLPSSAALGDACKKFEVASERTEEDIERLRRILASFRIGEAALLSRRDLRWIAAGIGSSPLISLNEISAIVAEIGRRPDRRLIRAVFRALLASYRDESIREVLRSFVAGYVHALSSNIRRFSEQSKILDGDGHLDALSKCLAESDDIYSCALSNGLSSDILAGNYGIELKLASIRDALKLSDAKAIERASDWVFDGIKGRPIGDFYETILSPFEAKSPPPDVQKVLMSVLVRKFGDPRIDAWPGLTGQGGAFRRDGCIATLKRWLSIEYLDLFIKIIEATADAQFKPRKSFWSRYFEKGVISDLTLVLAADANDVARRTRGQQENAEYMKWAKLNSASPAQSVLLMRLGDLIIAEWSHSGAMRFWKADDKSAPEFHLSDYDARGLRDGGLQIRVGAGYRPSVRHDPNGQWMIWARNAIEFHTGVRV